MSQSAAQAGVWGGWEAPHLTRNPASEAAQLGLYPDFAAAQVTTSVMQVWRVGRLGGALPDAQPRLRGGAAGRLWPHVPQRPHLPRPQARPLVALQPHSARRGGEALQCRTTDSPRLAVWTRRTAPAAGEGPFHSLLSSRTAPVEAASDLDILRRRWLVAECASTATVIHHSSQKRIGPEPPRCLQKHPASAAAQCGRRTFDIPAY